MKDAVIVPAVREKAYVLKDRFGIKQKQAEALVQKGRLTYYDVYDTETEEEIRAKVERAYEFTLKVRGASR
jgi:hypothetical protein